MGFTWETSKINQLNKIFDVSENKKNKYPTREFKFPKIEKTLVP